MADSYIQVAADGSGKKMQTVVNTVGADSVHAEVVTLADTTGTAITALPVTDNGGSLTVDGTVTGRIVGNAGAVMDGTSAPGTAPASSMGTLVQYKNTPPAPTDTQTVIAQADQAGNARITYGAASATLSAWSSATALNTTQTIYSNSGVTAATVMLQQSSGSFNTGAITFEVSFDGTNFVTAPSTAVVDPSDTTFALITIPYTLVTSTNKPFLLINSGWQALRIKLSTAITGTGTVTPVYTLLPEAPGRPVSLVSGPSGNKVDVAKVGGNAVSTAATGVQKVGIVGNTGSTLDGSWTGTTIGTQRALSVGGKVSYFNSAPINTTGEADSYPITLDGNGNTRTAFGSQQYTGTAWNSGTGLNGTQNIFINSGNSNIIVQLDQTTTISAGAITFEVSWDAGANWSTIPADAVMDPSSTSLAQIALPYTLQASTNKPFLIKNKGWSGLRLKLSTQITGTGSVTPYIHLYAGQNIANSDLSYLAGTAIATNAGNASAGTQRVVLATDQTQLTNALKVDGSAVTQPTKEVRAATPTQSSVANNTGNVTLLAANSSRLGATIFNDDTAGTGATLKVKLGATASATSFTVAIAPQGYYEVPFNYTGIIDGIASVGSGNARITELAA